ncbi:unnamed protein product [Bursaphelenchus xylophilus]|uniref:(pine wood nematode) hypothetical protein n=1 Tax=Bursaphelenchus xylophilus TaxID=6326 RepID=A0A1I7SUV8_BURXY|nr:unnamed protein product [Bursaphelenchus xylophilus]CAG9125842.1 unnamed protein product [Bursaphelenchus xylophilus]
MRGFHLFLLICVLLLAISLSESKIHARDVAAPSAAHGITKHQPHRQNKRKNGGKKGGKGKGKKARKNGKGKKNRKGKKHGNRQ